MTDAARAQEVVKGLSAMEEEWVMGWQGPAGAAFNCVAVDLYHKGLLIGRCDWNLNALGLAVRVLLERTPDNG